MKYYKSSLPEISLKYKTGDTKKFKVSSSADTFTVLHELFNQDTVELYEEFIVIFLNRSMNSIGWFRVSQGGISGTVVDIRIILATALKCAATNIIVAHNHPSKSLKPSDSDRNIITKLNNACKLVDINLIDSIIYTPEKYFSFADEDLL